MAFGDIYFSDSPLKTIKALNPGYEESEITKQYGYNAVSASYNGWIWNTEKLEQVSEIELWELIAEVLRLKYNRAQQDSHKYVCQRNAYADRAEQLGMSKEEKEQIFWEI